jgi:hypothetical protein
MANSTSNTDDLIDAVLSHLRSLAPSIRSSIAFQLLMLAGQITSVEDVAQFQNNTDAMIDAVEDFFVPNKGDIELGQFRALIHICAMLDHIYLRLRREDFPQTAAMLEQHANEIEDKKMAAIALSIPFRGAQMQKAVDEWRSLRESALNPEHLVDLEGKILASGASSS